MEFSVGNALGTSFRVWFRNFLPFTLLNALLHLPLLAWLASKLKGPLTVEKERSLDAVLAATGAINLVTGMFLTAAVTYGVVMELRGSRASIGKCLSVGLARLLPTLGVSLAFVIVVFGGVVLLVVPGVIFLCMLYVVVPASVIERPGFAGAFKRSAALTNGQRVQIFGMLILVIGASLAINGAINSGYDASTSDPFEAMANRRSSVYVSSMVEIITGVFGAILPAVTYAQLRFSKEGTQADDLAKVFG